MLQELTIAFRTLIKRPGYALSVILTLTLGIGASTMMFSLLDAAMLRPLPFAEPERLVMLTGVADPERSPRGGSFPEVGDWRTMNRTLDDVARYDETSLNMRMGTEAVRVEAEIVSAGYFPLLGASAALGRTFLPEEDAVPDRDAVAIISGKLWRDRFGRDPGVLGRTLYLNDRPFLLVGVMPGSFAGLSFDTDVWVPSMMVSLTSAPGVVEDRGRRWLGALGRLKEGITMARAQEDLDRVAAILEQQHPDYNRQRGVQLTSVHESLLDGTGRLMVALFTAVLLFLIVACANVASLQLARATSRRRELAVRLALGARRVHVLRQLLTESFVLSLAAGVFGAIVAAWSLGAVIALMPEGALPRHVQPSVDPRALAFTVVVSAAVGALVALVPGFGSLRRDLTGAIKEGARSAGPGLGSIRRPSTQQVLVVAEIALAMTLLSAAGLMIRSLERQMQVPLGFDPQGVTVARLTLPGARYTPQQRAEFVERLSERLEAVPLVRSAAIGSDLPFTGGTSAARLLPDVAPTADATLRYYRHLVTPEFFTTLAVPVLEGRAFTDRDRTDAPLVAIVNQAAARRIWGGESAIGRHVRMGGSTGPAVEIVGVVPDMRFRDLTSDLTSSRAEPDVYLPYAQRTESNLVIAVRSADGAPVPLAALQAAVSGLDAGLPLYSVRRLEDSLGRQTSTARFGSGLLTVFSGGALLLAAIGLYGLIAYVVGLSRREIAIRLALGADGRGVTTLIVRNAMTLVVVGVLAGVGGAIAAGRALESQPFQTRTADPVMYAVVAALLLTVTFVASMLPTRRAVRVAPQTALRGD
jgi:putative ABC transport system permease protein